MWALLGCVAYHEYNYHVELAQKRKNRLKRLGQRTAQPESDGQLENAAQQNNE